ncbi:MFS transporter, FSR family, fosmidomycin resistance protein [Arachidicoccus rhizosphaerae]|uniref:MFS transporter, FSR family, fosmidomycin resistance protein n=2 Tax=Arachidicoccus rhizosphaerae TaxID=551991 RepID=A0A1H4CWD0_9BACT|nr:MFS transporter, FSR family, fosmidomycin resistance protein [Arachidicoccus rhizosphaerae]
MKRPKPNRPQKSQGVITNLDTEDIKSTTEKTVFAILFTISFCHLLNDMMQSVIPAVYPIIKDKYKLSFTQIGLITLTFQLTASLLQPFVGRYTDKKPRPFSLSIGMGFTLIGLVALAYATSFYLILLSVALIGLGSSVFHPESSRVAHLASGGQKGLAQSIFQVGGNAGSAVGPLLAAVIIVPYGQFYIIWFALAAILGMLVLIRVGKWYQAKLLWTKKSPKTEVNIHGPYLSKKRVSWSIAILLVLIFSKYFYMASMTSYFTFYLIQKFNVSVQASQLYLFAFLGAVAIGTVMGGSLGDKFGRKYIIWVSILGVAPFTLLLPYVGLVWTIILAVIIGLILSSAFSAILVYATDLVPGKVGMIAGLFFGFAFGMGGIGSAFLGWLADRTSIDYIFRLCAYLPLLGIITGFLPNLEHHPKGHK